MELRVYNIIVVMLFIVVKGLVNLFRSLSSLLVIVALIAPVAGVGLSLLSVSLLSTQLAMLH